MFPFSQDVTDNAQDKTMDYMDITSESTNTGSDLAERVRPATDGFPRLTFEPVAYKLRARTWR